MESEKGYDLERFPAAYTQMLPGRRTNFCVWPGWSPGKESVERSNALVDKVLSEFELDEYVGCSPQEFDLRPIVAVRPPETSEKLIAVCAKWFKHITKRVRRTMTFQPFSLDNRSKLGLPVGKRVDDKLRVWWPFAEAFLNGDYSSVEKAPALQGIRLQWEKKSKVRKYTVASHDLKAYMLEADAGMRLGKNGRYCCKTRMVIAPSVENLAKQPYDSVVHHSLLTWPVCKPTPHLFRREGIKVEKLVAPDWNNFDHQAGAMGMMYARELGPVYEAACQRMWSQPVICRAGGWREAVGVRAKPGYVMQYWSGDSAVAPFGKYVVLSVMCDLVQHLFGLDDDTTIDTVQAGAYRDLLFLRDYGDDMLIGGSTELVDRAIEYMSTYVSMDLETPPRYLGDVFEEVAPGYWKASLSEKSYLLNFYVPERAPGTIFRPYPTYGFFQRRKDYTQWGNARTQAIIAREDEILKSFGVDFEQLHKRNEEEALEVSKLLQGLTYEQVYSKDYLLSAEQRAQLPFFNTVEHANTARLLKHYMPAEVYAAVKGL